MASKAFKRHDKITKMELKKTNLDGCFLIKKAIFNDHRGFFTENI